MAIVGIASFQSFDINNYTRGQAEAAAYGNNLEPDI